MSVQSDGPDIYRVQRGKPWYRRTWQAEWPGCVWAARGYTRRGVRASAWVRRRWGHRMEARYIRIRIVIRWVNGYDEGWYRQRYLWHGLPRIDASAGGGE